MKDIDLIKTVPSERQLNYMQTEFYAFIHFTVNTYTDKEWGDGTEPESIFNPTEFSAEQWVSAVRSAGMKGLILTCKHHDGFCLWPSKYTEHSVKNCPVKRDFVGEVAAECQKQGIKFGVYLSPWDRNNATYGSGKDYDDYFVAQLTELLTQYGEIFSVWFDGACGEGPNGKKQVYDWERYYSVIRELQPGACIVVCGPDIRWCGNEAGHTRKSEWSVVPARMRNTERTAKKSQKKDDKKFRRKHIRARDKDLGSRRLMNREADAIWYPAEVNTSIRPGWFFHEFENELVRPLEKLIQIYYNSVGGNATFLLNLPPDRRGLIHETDVARLKELGDYLKKTFGKNYCENAEITCDSDDGKNLCENIKTDSYDTYFKTPDGVTAAEVTVKLPEKAEVSHVVLKENVNLSQRIEKFKIYADVNGRRKRVFASTVVGYKRIAHFAPVKTDKITIKITDSRVSPTLSFVGIY